MKEKYLYFNVFNNYGEEYYYLSERTNKLKE